MRGYDTVTRIANAPDFIKGVVNLRGVIVPIIDMRIKFNLGTPTYDQFTVVIILNIAGTTMNEIVASVKRVNDIMSEITAASHEQEAGIGQINQAIAKMDTVTQQNAALVEEAAAAAESLQDQASNQAEVVSVFKLDGMHAASLATPAVAAVRSIRSTQPSRIAAPARKVAKAAPVRVALAASRPARSVTAATAAAGDEWEEF